MQPNFKLSMKYLFLISTILFSLSLSAQEDGIKFENSTFKEILAKAKKEKKLIFLDAMASWCGPCKMMDRNVFVKKSVGDYYNSTFVNARFDMEKGEGIEIAQKYMVRSYPTYLFLDGDGQLISKNMGYMEEKSFLEVGKEAQTNKDVGAGLKAKFEAGEKDPEFLIKIIQTYSDTDYELAKRASERYFKNKKTAAYTKEEVGYLIYFIKDTSDTNYKNFVNDKAEIIKILPETNYAEFNNQILMSKIMADAIDDKSKSINEKEFLAQAIPVLGEEEANKSLLQLQLNYYEIVDNFPKYEKAALEFYKNAEKFTGTDLLKSAWIFSEKATKKESLKTATMWAEKSVMQGENAENTYILALLYKKSGKIDEAKMYAKYSASIAKANGKDATMAENLISEIK